MKNKIFLNWNIWLHSAVRNDSTNINADSSDVPTKTVVRDDFLKNGKKRQIDLLNICKFMKN